MKKTITIMAVFLLLSMNTAFAAEYPSQVSYNLNNGIFEVRKTYEMQANQEPSAQVKQGFEQDGYSFVLTDIRGERPVMDDKYPIQKHPNYRFSADGGQPPYEKRFDIPSYEQNDLPHEIDIEKLEILEETQNEEENHAESRRTQPQGKAPLLHRCVDLRSRLRHLYARFRRR